MRKNTILKIFILLIFTAISLSSASLSSTEITNMVAEIKKERVGISLLKLESTGKPFLIKIPKKKEVKNEEEIVLLAEVVYSLKAILNKAAFINKKWYKQGDRLGDYKVGYISSTSVVLKSMSGNKTLSLEKKKKKFIKLNRGYK